MWKIYTKLENFVLPDLINPQFAYSEIVDTHVDENTRWLDLGCGHKFFSNTLPGSEATQKELVRRSEYAAGIDGDLHSLTLNALLQRKIAGDIQQLPFSDNSFNLVTANMVIEHVTTPALMLSEIYRVLEDGGKFIFHTPNIQNYKMVLAGAFPELLKRPIVGYLQKRGEGDIYPTHYRLNRIKLLRNTAESSGFEMEEIRLLQGPADSVMLGPLVIFELVWMKILSLEIFRKYQSNMIVVFKKQETVDSPISP